MINGRLPSGLVYLAEVTRQEDTVDRYGTFATNGLVHVNGINTAIVLANMTSKTVHLPAGTPVAALTVTPAFTADDNTPVVRDPALASEPWFREHVQEVLGTFPKTGEGTESHLEETWFQNWIRTYADRFVSSRLAPDTTTTVIHRIDTDNSPAFRGDSNGGTRKEKRD